MHKVITKNYCVFWPQIVCAYDIAICLVNRKREHTRNHTHKYAHYRKQFCLVLESLESWMPFIFYCWLQHKCVKITTVNSDFWAILHASKSTWIRFKCDSITKPFINWLSDVTKFVSPTSKGGIDWKHLKRFLLHPFFSRQGKKINWWENEFRNKFISSGQNAKKKESNKYVIIADSIWLTRTIAFLALFDDRFYFDLHNKFDFHFHNRRQFIDSLWRAVQLKSI